MYVRTVSTAAGRTNGRQGTQPVLVGWFQCIGPRIWFRFQRMAQARHKSGSMGIDQHHPLKVSLYNNIEILLRPDVQNAGRFLG